MCRHWDLLLDFLLDRIIGTIVAFHPSLRIKLSSSFGSRGHSSAARLIYLLGNRRRVPILVSNCSNVDLANLKLQSEQLPVISGRQRSGEFGHRPIMA
ncbi:hypothetical protein HHX47_DHR3001187 [Lentinula edodes]|nr:hypothetical protein HHX47_DHR3001187 [Lentinula edodes]